jgi:hypothetical protein
MALALNTSHPLYANILSFICPNEAGTALIDLKVPERTFTETNGAWTYNGSGVYGRHVTSPNVDNAHIVVSPVVFTGNTSTQVFSAMVVCNNTSVASGGGGNQPIWFQYDRVPIIDKAGGFAALSAGSGANPSFISDVDVLLNGGYSIAFNHQGTDVGNDITLSVNGTYKGSISMVGGAIRPLEKIGQGHAFARNVSDFVYWVFFDRVLTPTEITDLHASLGAGNAFALLDSGSSVVPVSFSGTIPTQSFTNGQVVSVDLSAYFSGTETPFTFANTGTALTGSDLTLSSVGLLSGTYNGTPITGVIVTGTDTATNVANSNAFNIEVSTAASNITISEILPALNSSLSITNTSGNGTITISDWASDGGVVIGNISDVSVDVYDISTGVLVYHTDNAQVVGGQCTISDAAIVNGAEYEVTALKFNGVDYDIGIAIITAT